LQISKTIGFKRVTHWPKGHMFLLLLLAQVGKSRGVGAGYEECESPRAIQPLAQLAPTLLPYPCCCCCCCCGSPLLITHHVAWVGQSFERPEADDMVYVLEVDGRVIRPDFHTKLVWGVNTGGTEFAPCPFFGGAMCRRLLRRDTGIKVCAPYCNI
jgi:hypothetical protein